MLHPVIQHPLHQKNNHKPIHWDKSQWEIKSEQPDYGYAYSKGYLATQIQKSKQIINYFQIHILQLIYLSLWNTLSVLRV